MTLLAGIEQLVYLDLGIGIDLDLEVEIEQQVVFDLDLVAK